MLFYDIEIALYIFMECFYCLPTGGAQIFELTFCFFAQAESQAITQAA